jgi:hypothetical protein
MWERTLARQRFWQDNLAGNLEDLRTLGESLLVSSDYALQVFLSLRDEVQYNIGFLF